MVVDGANVVGSRPDGWWHDRAGAARRLAGQLVAALAQDPVDLAAALTGPPGTAELRGAPGAGGRRGPGRGPAHAPAPGRGARPRPTATATIAALADDLERGDVLVVTADRELRDRVRAAGATTVGPGTLLRALPDSDPGQSGSRSTPPR